MTVQVQQPFTNYPSAAPGATVFAYEFKVAAAADIQVTINAGDPLELGVDFTIDGVGNNGGGNVTLLTPCIGGEVVLLRRSMALNRATDYQQNGDFPAPVVNGDFDRVWLALQQFGQDLLRSLKLPFSTATTQELPQTVAQRANKALVFDASGNITVSDDNYNDQAAAAAASALAAQAAEAATAVIASQVSTDATAASNAAAAAAASAASINPSNLIHTTGNETMAGIKTFTNPPVFPSQTLEDFKWLSKAIGEIYFVDDSMAGVGTPPTNSSLYRYIKLTAADAYNTGILTSETVSGSAPLVNATAVINLPGSPINGRTVNLINTERRVIRAGSAGTLEQDAMQGHFHDINDSSGSTTEIYNSSGTGSYNRITSGSNSGGIFKARTIISDGANGSPRTAPETRVKSIGASAYMRIK